MMMSTKSGKRSAARVRARLSDVRTAAALDAPLYQQLADRLIGQIASGAMRPGDRLPTEAEFSHQFGMSRITVRQALAILTQRNLIERFPSRGSFVKHHERGGVWELRSIDDLVQLGHETETQVISWGLVPPPSNIASFFGASAKVYRLRAVRTQASAPIYFAENYLRADLGRQIDPKQLATRTLVDIVRNELAVSVQRAHEDIEAGVAGRALAKRLWIMPGRPVLIQRIDLYDEMNVPLQTGTGWWRSDRFKRRYVLRSRSALSML